RQVVVVAVRVEGVADAHASHSGHVEVAAHVALRVEQQRLARLLGTDEVRRVPERLEVELLEDHAPSLPGRASGEPAGQPLPLAACAATARCTSSMSSSRTFAMSSSSAAAGKAPGCENTRTPSRKAINVGIDMMLAA